MGLTVYLTGHLATFAEGHVEIKIDESPATVAEALELLWAQHPGLRDRVLTEQGQVRQHVNIFVGSANIRDANGLETEIPDGIEMCILPSVSGG